MQNFAYDNNVKSEPYSLATDDKALKYKRTAIQDTNTKNNKLNNELFYFWTRKRSSPKCEI